ncbi:hypothetical protein [Bacillus sp. 2205SS5-2]|uniref:hypothetical protein n=1 Tax=Bacillus sp. 2205SS5-2 TaxID=3109031 RepID=UPI003005F585
MIIRFLLAHGWAGRWRNSICPNNHYDCSAYEVLVVPRGLAIIMFGELKEKLLGVTNEEVMMFLSGLGFN